MRWTFREDGSRYEGGSSVGTGGGGNLVCLVVRSGTLWNCLQTPHIIITICNESWTLLAPGDPKGRVVDRWVRGSLFVRRDPRVSNWRVGLSRPDPRPSAEPPSLTPHPPPGVSSTPSASAICRRRSERPSTGTFLCTPDVVSTGVVISHGSRRTLTRLCLRLRVRRGQGTPTGRDASLYVFRIRRTLQS